MRNTLFQTLPFASSILAFFNSGRIRKQEPESVFTAVFGNKGNFQTQTACAYRSQGWLNIEAQLANGDKINLYLYDGYQEGSYELNGYTLHYATVIKNEWLGQTYTTYSFHGSGHVQIQQLTPHTIAGVFCLNVVVPTPDYDIPSDILCITDGRFKVPILDIQ